MMAGQFQSGPVTLYAQVCSVLRDRIVSGAWKHGEEIPTLSDLVEEFSLARVTVRQAVQMLVKEGFLSSQRGRRTVVTYEAPRANANPLYSSIGSIDRDLENYSIHVLSTEEVEGLPPHFAGPGRGVGRYMRIRKVDCNNDQPYCVADNFVALSLYTRFPERAEQRMMLSRLVRDYARPALASGHETIAVGAITYEEATHLGVPLGSPVARVDRVLLLPGEKVAYFGKVIYRADRFRISRDITHLLGEPMPGKG